MGKEYGGNNAKNERAVSVRESTSAQSVQAEREAVRHPCAERNEHQKRSVVINSVCEKQRKGSQEHEIHQKSSGKLVGAPDTRHESDHEGKDQGALIRGERFAMYVTAEVVGVATSQR